MEGGRRSARAAVVRFWDLILRTMGSQVMDSSRGVPWSDLHLWKSILAAMPRRDGRSPCGCEETMREATP